MKKLFQRFALILILLSTFSFAAIAQNRSSTGEHDRARERAREEYDVQKKLEQMEKLRAEKEVQFEKLREEREAQYEKLRADKYGNYVIAPPDGGVYFTGPNAGQSSQLSLSKSFDGESTKNEGTFEVDEKVAYINFSINGSVKEGRIRIIITLPNGEKLKEMTIDNTADIQFNQMIRPRSEENKYSGKWNYEIEAVKAVGNYRLSLQTK